MLTEIECVGISGWHANGHRDGHIIKGDGPHSGSGKRRGGWGGGSAMIGWPTKNISVREGCKAVLRLHTANETRKKQPNRNSPALQSINDAIIIKQ